MKNSILLLILFATLQSCAQEDIPQPTLDTCDIAHLTVYTNRVSFVRNPDIDTIWFRFYQTQTGWWIPGFWTDNINWDCIGFDFTDTPYDLIVWTRTDTCTFTIPAIEH